MTVFLPLLGLSAFLSTVMVTLAADGTTPHQSSHAEASACPHSGQDPVVSAPSTPSADESTAFENVQIETSDLTRHERFFEAVLHAPVVQRMDHPQVDSLRGYCYRGVLIVVRQDLRTPRPTGWVQINFTVSDAAAVQEELERSVRASSLYELSEEERAKVVRFRLKPDVMRGARKAVRLEVFGPEGFMIGFDQYK
jgi:hypothetical protein